MHASTTLILIVVVLLLLFSLFRTRKQGGRIQRGAAAGYTLTESEIHLLPCRLPDKLGVRTPGPPVLTVAVADWCSRWPGRTAVKLTNESPAAPDFSVFARTAVTELDLSGYRLPYAPDGGGCAVRLSGRFRTLTLPEGVTHLRWEEFQAETLICPCAAPPELDGTPPQALTVLVPAGSVAAYAAAWPEAFRISAISPASAV